MPCYVATPRHAYHSGISPFYHRGAVSPFADFTSTLQPLFRLLDEELGKAASVSSPKSYQPRFDVREEAQAYHLQGELPGVSQNDISIEFKDDNTLVISGSTVRESKTNNGDQAASAEATSDAASESGSAYKQPTVEDEFVDVAETEKAPTSEEKGKQVEKPAAAEEPKHKYWVSERSVGEFHRSFTFPGHVNQEAVSASLKNGILNVVVPKAVQKEPRRIAVEG